MIIANARVSFYFASQPVQGNEAGTGDVLPYYEGVRVMIEPTNFQALAFRQAGQLVQARWTAWIENPAVENLRLIQVGDCIKIDEVYFPNSPLRSYVGKYFRIVDYDSTPGNWRLALQEVD